LRLVAPLVPVTVKPLVPVGVAAPTLTVSALVVEPFAGGVTEAGAKPHEAPLGNPPHESATGEAKPPVEVTVQVEPPLDPCAIERLEGAQETEKSGVGVAVTVRLIGEVRVVAPLVPVAWMP
jgi:hypothetical protein